MADETQHSPDKKAQAYEREDTLDEIPSWKKDVDLPQGTHVDRYIILGLVGKGGMGAVYKAYDPELDRSIALKILTLSPQEGETVSLPQARLMREAQALAKLNHPNVVFVFDVGTYEESVYIAMEYVEGKTLRDWLKEDQPTHKEIIAVMVAAGRGLQAAHLEGIVHRDFKPENLIVGNNGQVKVLDFGLARAADFEGLPIEKTKSPSQLESQSGDQLLSQPLTQVGILIGTPAYMAPEHFLYEELDEKTDQFSFCLTLFEALYGKRPFGGDTKTDLEENVTQGRIQVPNDVDVRDWIKDIILRGLAISKTDRYASMADLLEELVNDPDVSKRAKRKKRLFAGSMVMVATLQFLIWLTFFRAPALCTGGQDKLAPVWNAVIRQQVKQLFLKTDLSYAPATLDSIQKRMEDYANRWKTAYVEACEATHLKGEQSDEVLDLRMGCLRDRLREFSALAEVFAVADKTVVGKAVQATSALPSLSDCSNIEYLQATTDTSFVDEKTKQKVQDIHRRLAKVKAWRNSGQYNKALLAGKSLLKEAIQRKRSQLVVEAHLVVGQTLVSLGRFEEAKSELENAYYEADVAGDALGALQAANQMIFAVGQRLADHKAGERWYWLATIKQKRLRLGRFHPEVAKSLHNMGSVQLGQGRYEKALASFQAALAIRKKVFSPDHPGLASSYNNMGLVYWSQGRHAQALEAFLNTLAIEQKALGSDHPDVGGTLNNIGMVYREQGKFRKALEVYQRAIAIREKALGPTHPYLANTLNNLGILYQDLKRFDKSLKVLQGALSIFERSLGAQHPKVADVINNIGSVYLDQGDHTSAQTYYQNSLAFREKVLGTQHPVVANSLVGMSEIALLQGNELQAKRLLERLVSICASQTCDALTHCSGLFSLAQVHKTITGDTLRSVEIAKKAKLQCQKMPMLKGKLDKVKRWLAAQE